MSWVLLGENFKNRKPIQGFNLAVIDNVIDSPDTGSLISFLSDTTTTTEQECCWGESNAPTDSKVLCDSTSRAGLNNQHGENLYCADVFHAKKIKISQSTQCRLHKPICYDDYCLSRSTFLVSDQRKSTPLLRHYRSTRSLNRIEDSRPFPRKHKHLTMDSSSFNSNLELSHSQFKSPLPRNVGQWEQFEVSEPPQIRVTSPITLNRSDWISFEEDVEKSPRSDSFSETKSYDAGSIMSCMEDDDVDGKANETPSEFSDEIISLDYESDDQRLHDRPAKKYPKVELFQAKAHIEKAHSEQSLHSVDSFESDPLDTVQRSWSFWYRYPDNARRMRKKKWIPVTVTLDSGFIKLNGLSKKGVDVCKEYPLHPFFVFTIPKIHKGNKEGRVHSVKLQYVKYKEVRKLNRSIEHVPVYTSILKFASRNLISMREFLSEVERYIRKIPTYRNNIVTYRQEGMFIDCDDDCHYLLSGDGRILQYNITVQLRLRTFLTGSPNAVLYLNDATDRALLENIDDTPPAVWIEPKQYEYHPCVDTTYDQGGVKFLPPDGCSFELMRLRVRSRRPPPIVAKSSLEITSCYSVTLKATLQVCGDALKYCREDVLLYIPIPTAWSNLFVRGKTMRGRKKYVKARATRKTGDAAEVAFNRVTLQVSEGCATFEPAYGAVVWRLGSLPATGYKPTDAVHSFQCDLQLPFAVVMPDEFQPFAYVEFNVGRQIASDVIVAKVTVDGKTAPEKWVSYRSNYVYKINMKLLENGKEKQASKSSNYLT